MDSPPLTNAVTALVIAATPSDRYRAGRTLRALQTKNIPTQNAIDCTALTFSQLADYLLTLTSPVWFLRAGAWPAENKPSLSFPPPSTTGRPLCALGATRLPPDNSSTPPLTPAWQELLRTTGGDLNTPHITLPQLTSIYLESQLARHLATHLFTATSFDAALLAAIKTTDARLIRWPSLDCAHDPRLRIAEVITSLQRGGAERVVLDLHSALPAFHCRPQIIVTGRVQRSTYPAPPNTIDLSLIQGPREIRIRAAAHAAHAIHADLLHAHLLSAADLKTLRSAEIPVLLTLHNMRQGWPADFTTLSPHDVALFAACSQQVERDALSAKLPAPIRTAWNGIDFSACQPSPEIQSRAAHLRRQFSIPENAIPLLAIANPRPQKRLERLPAILAHLQKLLPTREILLIIAGENRPYSDEAHHSLLALNSEIARLQLAPSIRTPGVVEDIPALLAASNLLLSVSAWEGLSLAMLEALAMNLPIVATNVGGAAELALNTPNLTLLPENFSDDLAASTIASALEKPPTPSRETAEKNFTHYRMAERYAQLFPRTIEAARPSATPSGLLLITNNFSIGGAQSSARRLLAELASRKIPARAAVIQEDPANPTPGTQSLRRKNIPVLALPPAGTCDPLLAVEQLLASIDAAPPQAILLWNLIPHYKILLADLLHSIPLFDVSPGEMNFSSLQSYFAAPRPGLPYRTPSEYAARLTAAIVKYSGELPLAQSTFNIPIHIIPNGVPVPPNLPDRRPPGPILNLGTAARLSPQKKFEELFAALTLAHPHLPPYTLRIAGGPDGDNLPYAAYLREISKHLPIEWLGDQLSIPKFLADLDLFLMISEPAGCPNASLEAMAAGLPIIATNFGGVSEQILDHHTGRLTPRNNPQAFADALVEAAHNPALRQTWSQNSHARAKQLFSIDRMADNYQRVLSLA